MTELFSEYGYPTTRTVSFNFGGTTTITSAHFTTFYQTAAAGTTGTIINATSFASTVGGVINETSTGAFGWFRVQGLIRVDAAGTLIPQIAFSAALGGTNTTGIDSYMKFTPLGTNPVTTSGAWG